MFENKYFSSKFFPPRFFTEGNAVEGSISASLSGHGAVSGTLKTDRVFGSLSITLGALALAGDGQITGGAPIEGALDVTLAGLAVSGEGRGPELERLGGGSGGTPAHSWLREYKKRTAARKSVVGKRKPKPAAVAHVAVLAKPQEASPASVEALRAMFAAPASPVARIADFVATARPMAKKRVERKATTIVAPPPIAPSVRDLELERRIRQDEIDAQDVMDILEIVDSLDWLDAEPKSLDEQDIEDILEILEVVDFLDLM